MRFLKPLILASLAMLATGDAAVGYNLFGPYPWGEEATYYNKWGDIFHAGTPGGTITWSLMPDGTTIDPAFTDPNISGTNSLISIMNGLGYSEALGAIERGFDQWSAAANIYFVQVPDSGEPFHGANASPPNTGQIRLGAFAIVGGGGAVGYAPPPNGGNLEGDVLLNSNNTFFFDDGDEGELIDVFNDFEGLILHELGHAVGMAHSDVCSVMSADSNCFKYVNRLLDADDVAGVQFLYGPALAADFDRDNGVDAADLQEWSGDFGLSGGATATDGDADNDGDADGADFLAWQRELGSGGAAAAISLRGVPEPAGLALGVAALAVLATRGRLPGRHRRR